MVGSLQFNGGMGDFVIALITDTPSDISEQFLQATHSFNISRF